MEGFFHSFSLKATINKVPLLPLKTNFASSAQILFPTLEEQKKIFPDSRWTRLASLVAAHLPQIPSKRASKAREERRLSGEPKVIILKFPPYFRVVDESHRTRNVHRNLKIPSLIFCDGIGSRVVSDCDGIMSWEDDTFVLSVKSSFRFISLWRSEIFNEL